MRKIEYLSPSAINMYLRDPQKYYQHYLSDTRRVREPQNQAMSIGSAFDAYVKSYLHQNLLGGKDERYDLNNIFEAQVEPQWRDWAWKNGEYVFEQYKQSGCLSDLMLMLKNSASDPRFEFEVRGAIKGYREGVTETIDQVVLLGKPDVDFVTDSGVHVILDFKVNGYCSNYNTSPKPYYLRMRAAGGTNFGKHKNCRPFYEDGVEVNRGCYLEEIDKDWARQLAIYGWLCGESVGGSFVTIIHQVVCNPVKDSLPKIRIAEHSNLISPGFQKQCFGEAVDLWNRAHSDHFFKDLSKEESDSLCTLLDGTMPNELAGMV